MKVEIQLKPKAIFFILLLIVLLLLTASLTGQYFKFFLGHDYVFGFVKKFSLDGEANYPTWFASFLLLSCSFFLFLIARQKRGMKDPFYKKWFVLALIFFALSIEEIAGFHELIFMQTRYEFGLEFSGAFFFSWVIPALIIVTVITLSYIKFLFHLPRRTKFLFILSGSIYTFGALGFEMLGGVLFETYGYESFIYAFTTNIEECLEMIGLILFLYSLMSYLETLGMQKTLADIPTRSPVTKISRPQASQKTATKSLSSIRP